MSDLGPPYEKPPITEAIIALHLANRISVSNIEKMAKKEKAEFPVTEDVYEVQATFDVKTKKQSSQIEKIGMKLRSEDARRIVQMLPQQLAVSHIAPYTKWEDLLDEAMERWANFRNVCKDETVVRVSTRFVNRIDIPHPEGADRFEVKDYLLMGIGLPPAAKGAITQNFRAQANFLDNSSKYMFAVVSGTSDPVILQHSSLLLDIDVFTARDLSLKDNDIWTELKHLRLLKNNMFESCITDKARALFR